MKFIPSHFCFFVAIVNGTAFIISYIVNLLFLDKNAANFCMLILFPANLLNLLINSDTVLVESLGFPVYWIIPSTNEGNLTSSYFSCMPFLSSFYLILLRFPVQYWTRVMRVNLLEEMFSVWCWLWVYHIQHLLCWGKILLFLIFSVFNFEWMLIFIKCYSVSIAITWFLSFILLMADMLLSYVCWTILASLQFLFHHIYLCGSVHHSS